MKKLRSSAKGTIIFVSIAVALVVLSLLAHYHSRFPADLQVELFVQRQLGNSIGDPLMRAISFAARDVAGPIIAVAAALAFVAAHRWRSGLLVAGLSLFSVGHRLVKLVVERPRPSPELVHVLQVENSSGFPSGHAAFAVAFFGGLCLLATMEIERTPVRRAAQATTIILALLVGLSRVYLGAHWPSDVLGGYLFGGLGVAAAAGLWRRKRQSTFGHRAATAQAPASEQA